MVVAGQGQAGLSEFGRESLNIAGVRAQLGVSGPLADAGQRPPDGLGAVVRDARADQRVDDFQLRRFEPDHHVRDVALGCSALVVQSDDETAPAVAAGVFEPDPEVLDFRPPLGQLAPELPDCRAMGVLELKCPAGLGPFSWRMRSLVRAAFTAVPVGAPGRDQGPVCDWPTAVPAARNGRNVRNGAWLTGTS